MLNKKIKVHLLVGKLPLYKDLLNYPPENVVYTSNKIDVSKDIVKYYSPFRTFKRKIASILLEKFKIPRMMYIFDDSDLIHSNRGILVLNRKPWVIDIDYVVYFFGLNLTDEAINPWLKNLVFKFLSSDYCKKIICWSNVAKFSVVNMFKSDKINNKTEVLYPAIPAIRIIKKRKSDKIKLLYVSSLFVKGGKELLSAFKILLEKYDNIELIFKCDLPEKFKQKYNFKEIRYIPYRSQLLPRDELIKKFHMKSDIFVYPTLSDLFGLCLLDAMVAGLPIVTTNTFAIPEIVGNGKNGFLVDPSYKWYDESYLPRKNIKADPKSFSKCVNQLVEKLSLLIEDSSLRKRMGREGRKMVEKGKFSIGKKNNELRRIYEEALGY